MTVKFTRALARTVQLASRLASDSNKPVGPGHLLDAIAASLGQLGGMFRVSSAPKLEGSATQGVMPASMDPGTQSVLGRAVAKCHAMGQSHVTRGHLLFALTEDESLEGRWTNGPKAAAAFAERALADSVQWEAEIQETIEHEKGRNSAVLAMAGDKRVRRFMDREAALVVAVEQAEASQDFEAAKRLRDEKYRVRLQLMLLVQLLSEEREGQ
ncbi:MAG: hypothetical protein R3F56_14865 [Planctomycetota bacterium]